MWVFLFAIFLLFDDNEALKANKTVVPTKFFNRFETFSFAEGGTALIRGTLHFKDEANLSTIPAGMNPSYRRKQIFIFYCGMNEYQSRTRSNSWYQICNTTNKDKKSDFRLPLDGSLIKITFQDPSEFYYFAIIDCTFSYEKLYSVNLDYHFTSDSTGNELSYEDQFEPYTEAARTGAHAFAFLVWSVIMMVQYKFLTPFHSVFLFVLFSKLCVAALDMSYWWVYFGYGNRIPIFLNIEKVVYAISEGGILIMLFMIARGFRITRSSLLVKAAKTYAFISVVVFFFLVTFSFLNPDFYWLTFLVIYFFVLPNIYSAITTVYHFLVSSINHIDQNQLGNLPDYFQDYCVALRNKKSLIGQVRIIVVAYFGVVRLATCFVYVLSPWYYNWFQSGVDYAGNAAICLCLIYVLFPKKDTYFNNVDDFQRFTQIQNLIDRQIEDNNGRVAEQMNVIPWDLSKIVFVFWPTQNENQTSGDHDSILLDSEESKNIKRDDKNERGTTLSASIGYEELFYLNEASKANEKLI